MIDPSLIVFGIRALFRIEHEGEEAYNQYVRDQDVLFPEPELPDFRNIDFLRATFVFDPKNAPLIGVDAAGNPGPLARFWSTDQNGPNPAVPGAQDALFLAATQLKADELAQKGGVLAVRSREIAGARLLKQWAKDKQPVGPIARLALTLADVTLEYVGANPSILGIGGNGEKLIGAIATNLAVMIPDDGNQFGPQSQLVETTIGIFLHAGLKTLNEHPDLVIGKTQWQTLIEHTLPPLLETLPSSLAEQSNWRDVAEALLGPAASAAIGTLADNPTAFFGSRLDTNQALGALTRALLKEASARGLKNQFSEAGFIGLYRAALGVAAERPELFLGRSDGKPVQSIAGDLLHNIAENLRTAPFPFNGDLGAQLAAAVIDVLKTDGAGLLDAGNAWENLVPSLSVQVIDALKGALENPAGAATGLSSSPRLIAFARAFLAPVVKTPGMLAPGNTELQRLVESVVAAMAKDLNLLLSPEDWLEIASVAAREAAANPQRLLKLLNAPAGTTAPTLCTAVISDLLAVATAEPKDRAAGGVLFGATLREAIAVALRAASGNADAVTANQPAVRGLLTDLGAFARAHPGTVGSKELLFLFRNLINRAVASGPITLTDQLVTDLLTGGAAR